MTRKLNLLGLRFDKLTVIAEAPRDKNGWVLWLCRCDCGNHAAKRSGDLVGRSQQQKGCRECGLKAMQANRIKHGDTTHSSAKPLYNSWNNMHARCSRNTKKHRYWAGKGIKVCAEWDSYLVFKAWSLANGYQAGLSIDRIDPDGHYEPANCRWVTVSQNTVFSLERRWKKNV